MTTKNQTIDLIGRCPVCRAEMVNFDNLVVCPNQDYKALFAAWDGIWTAFDPELGDADNLLATLLKLNIAKSEESNHERRQRQTQSD